MRLTVTYEERCEQCRRSSEETIMKTVISEESSKLMVEVLVVKYL